MFGIEADGDTYLTVVIDEPSLVASVSGVDDVHGVDGEHVAAEALRRRLSVRRLVSVAHACSSYFAFVFTFAFIRQTRPHHFARVLDNHLSFDEIDERKQAAAVNRRRANEQGTFREVVQMKESQADRCLFQKDSSETEKRIGPVRKCDCLAFTWRERVPRRFRRIEERRQSCGSDSTASRTVGVRAFVARASSIVSREVVEVSCSTSL